MTGASLVAPSDPPTRVDTVTRRHPLAVYIARRVAQGVLTLLVASFVIYFAINVLPGNVASILLGKHGNPAAIRKISDTLDLNQPFLLRYVHWLGGVVHGNFGYSGVSLAQTGTKQSVIGLIGTPFRNSAILAGLALVLLGPLALGLGVVSGVFAARPADTAISAVSLVLTALPEFVLGTFLILIFFTWLHLLPPVALVAPGQTPLSEPKALILPVLTLLGASAASSARQIRAGMVDVLRQNYVGMARINGVPERRVLWRYALRNALAPSVQIFAQSSQYLLGGIIIVESVYSYPGIGSFLVAEVGVRDVTVVEAIALILAALYIAVNIVADILVLLLVPRLRTGIQ